MRIGFVNHTRRKVGGAEVYVDSVMPALAAAGHEIACLIEDDSTSDRELIRVPSGAPQWFCSQLGPEDAVKRLKAWRPDVCFTHGLHDTHLESQIAAMGHSALYVHNYYGTCISGDKTQRNGVPKQCQRVFGARCLAHYFPDRCGGRSPATMWKQYRLQSNRLGVMRRYRTLIANSQYIAAELDRHGLKSECLYPFTGGSQQIAEAADFGRDPLVVLFAGRMHELKGAHILANTAPEIQRRLARKLHVLFVGDGPDRPKIEGFAASLRNENLSFEFTGWIGNEALRRQIVSAHLLVMPSIWPEPFGLSGLEAGLLGVPAVAFAVGGIPEWLHDGVNGHLATLPATSQSLAEAVIRVFCHADHYQQLRRGALEVSGQFSIQKHLGELVQIFERCAA